MIPPRPDRTARRTSIDLDAYDDAALVAAHLAGPAADRQAAFTALMRRHKQPLYRLILAQIGDPDEALDLDVAAGKPRDLQINVAINNSFGFGGHNVALVFQRA